MIEKYKQETSLTSFAPYNTLLNGGKGSGNFGHAGRPGKVGGSSSSGIKVENLSKDEYNKAVKDFYNGLTSDERKGFSSYSFSPDHQGSSSLNREPNKEWVKSGTKMTAKEWCEKYADSQDPEIQQMVKDISSSFYSSDKKVQKNRENREIIDPITAEYVANKDLREYYEKGGDERIKYISTVKQISSGKYVVGNQSTIITKDQVEQMKKMDSIIASKGISFDKDIVVERRLPKEALDQIISSIKGSGKYRQEGFTSTSAFSMTERGATGVRMDFGSEKVKIVIPKNTKMGFMAGFADGDKSVEQQYEILLPSRTEFKSNLKPDTDGVITLRKV